MLVFFQQYRANKNLIGPGWWLLWSAAESIGFVLILFRNNEGLLPIIIILQDPVMILGVIFIFIGIVKFLNRQVNTKLIVLLFSIFVLVHEFFFLIVNDIFARTLLFNVYLSGFGFITAYNLFKYKSPSIRFTANFITALFVLYGSIFAYRSGMILFGADFNAFMAVTFFNISQYFAALIISLLWTFGFIIMLNQKLNSEISEVKNQFEQFFHLNPDAVFIVRLDNEIIVDCNKGFTDNYGYDKYFAVGKSSIELGLWKNLQERAAFFSKLREHGSFQNYETVFCKNDGENVYILLSANIISIKDLPHIICVTKNITDRKKDEQEIKLKNEKLLMLNSEREKFYSIIAHDLKSPFQGLIGSSDILFEQYDSLTEKEKLSFINNIKNLSRNSYKLLENLLEWTMLQTGAFSYDPDYFNLLVELHPTISLLKQTAAGKNIAFDYEIDNMLFINADKNMISTIIRNLVSNSIKYTNNNGKVSLVVKKFENSVEFYVKDSGIGIDNESLDKLFIIDKSSRRRGTNNEEGTGLGLLLCKEMIEKHNGSFYVVSQVGKGTTFSFSIPQ